MSIWDQKIIDDVENNNFQKVIDFYEQLISVDDDRLENYFLLGIAYLLNKNQDVAQSIWMSVLLENNNFIDNLNYLLKILSKEAKHQSQKNNLSFAYLLYSNIEELLSNIDFNEEKNKAYYSQIYNDIGSFFEKYGDKNKTILAYEKALKINHSLDNYLTFGQYLQKKNMLKAVEIYHQLIIDYPNNASGYAYLIFALYKIGNVQEGEKIARIASQKFPDNLLLKFDKYLLLPSIYETEKDILIYRQKFVEGLNSLVEEKINLDSLSTQQKGAIIHSLASHVNFELAYQCFNHKDLQIKYGNFLYQILHQLYPQWTQPKAIKKRNNQNKIRVGYISDAMDSGVIAHLAIGWLVHHDRSQFEIYSYHLGSQNDSMTEKFKNHSDVFHSVSVFPQICQQVLADELDILVFLEIGRTGKMGVLGSLRLAPIQCTTWCHPETSGLKNIDYFLSSDLMEPDNGQDHYSEKLILLPNIGVSYALPEIPSPMENRQFFLLDDNNILYLCCQSLVKYLPNHDYILPEIAQRVNHCQFIFLELPNADLAKIFKKRLKSVFDTYNLDFNQYCLFFPGLSHELYLKLNSVCDVFLDSFGWSGGHTTLEAIACGLPVVTCPGEFMRGRHSYGILKMLGVEETIALTEQEYIDIAVALGQDKYWREQIKEKITANYDKLYDDLECVKGLEKFYQEVLTSKI